jgi:predicted transcriptional regulator
MSAQTQPVSTIDSILDPDALARLDAVACHQNSSRSEIIREAVDNYLKELALLEEAVERGRADIRAGRVYTQEQVEDYFRKLGVDLD